MNKLAISLGFMGAFALGCATASVLIDDVGAAPASGTYNCTAFVVPYLANANSVADGLAEKHNLWLPEGWTPVGGGSTASNPVVVACRQAP
jgi:hypothetical protein